MIAAAEATDYGNYERWEAGSTHVGPQNLRATVDAFAVDDGADVPLRLARRSLLADAIEATPVSKPARIGETRRSEPARETTDGGRAGVQVTDRDVEVLGWVTDQYAVRPDVIRWLLGIGRPLSDSRTRAIVARWQRAGLVERRRFFAGAPNVVWPTVPAPPSSGPAGGRGRRRSASSLTTTR